jgi:toxin ParE1/3/4
VSFGYVVRPQADRDIDCIADYLAEDASLDTGLRFIDTAYKTFALLASQPNLGWSCRRSNRIMKSVRVFRVGEPFEKYLIFYQPATSRIEILRILHGARDLDNQFSMDDVL